MILFEKGDYETSNIYFNYAILGGYKPKVVAERKLAYNYWLLGKQKNMFQVLSYLVKNENATETDINNAIYLALTENSLENARTWIELASQRFPDSDDLKALKSWHLRVTGSKNESQTLIDSLLQKNPNNLIALIQDAILSYENGDGKTAKTRLEKAKSIDA